MYNKSRTAPQLSDAKGNYGFKLGSSPTRILFGNKKEGQFTGFSANNSIEEDDAAGRGSWRGAGWQAQGCFAGRQLGMQNAVDVLMLICATLAAMAFGVLAAYGVCRAAFVVFRIHALQVAQRARTRVARVSQL